MSSRVELLLEEVLAEDLVAGEENSALLNESVLLVLEVGEVVQLLVQVLAFLVDFGLDFVKVRVRGGFSSREHFLIVFYKHLDVVAFPDLLAELEHLALQLEDLLQGFIAPIRS